MSNILAFELRLDQLLSEQGKKYVKEFKLKNGGTGASIIIRAIPLTVPDNRNNTHFLAIDTGKGGEKIYCGRGVEFVKRNFESSQNNQINNETEPF